MDLSRLFEGQTSLLEWLYAQSQARRWQILWERFAAALERSAQKALTPGTLTPQKLQNYLRALHLEDLALATACVDGNEAAWEHFFCTYRAYLRAATAAILRRFEQLAEDETGDGGPWTQHRPPVQPVDPLREHYVASFTRALQAALDHLDPQEKERLRLYYAEEKTLAEIGRMLGEHESSVSRHLDRARRDLRQAVESILRRGIGAANGFAAQPGLSDAEIALCFEYSAGDSPIDLEKLLPRPESPGPAAGKRTP